MNYDETPANQQENAFFGASAIHCCWCSETQYRSTLDNLNIVSHFSGNGDMTGRLHHTVEDGKRRVSFG